MIVEFLGKDVEFDEVVDEFDSHWPYCIEGEVQCSFGDSYYYDTCYCVLVKYWKKIGNKFMADGYEKLLANVIRLKTL